MEKYLDNLRRVAKIKHVSHESLAGAIGKERTVLTRKLNGHIPLTVDEYLTLVSHLEVDLFSLLTAATEADLQEVARMGIIKVKDANTEIPILLERFKERYEEHLERDRREVFSFLVNQLIELFRSNKSTS